MLYRKLVFEQNFLQNDKKGIADESEGAQRQAEDGAQRVGQTGDGGGAQIGVGNQRDPQRTEKKSRPEAETSLAGFFTGHTRRSSASSI